MAAALLHHHAAGAVRVTFTDQPHDLLGRVLEPLDQLSAQERPIAGFGEINIVVTIRATFGMLLSLAVYGDFLCPANAKPTREAVIDECLALVFDG